jgi:RNA polymerase sigma-70 factor (ECF subfamily)
MQVPTLTEEDHARIEELASLGELRVTVADALEGLDGDQREALRLRVVEERPYSAIAATLGVSEATVRARVSRGLRALARSLDQTLTAEEPVR